MIRLFLLFCIVMVNPLNAETVRLKDIVTIDGVRGNDLVGYGLVVGLNGTGDGIRNSPFTEEILAGLLERLGVNVAGEDYRPKNVAAVLVTATLPPFARAGSHVDVTVSAIGDAKSLLGGTLVMTPLNGADGQIYAVSQGVIISGGISSEGVAARVVQGVPTAGSIPSGARVEREVEFNFNSINRVRLSLKNPDFSTAQRVERSVNRALGLRAARMIDAGTISIDVSAVPSLSAAEVLARVENSMVDVDSRARVVVDQRSGTIVIDRNVRIGRVAVAQGGLTLRVDEQPVVVQPNPFSEGDTIIVPRTVAEISRDGSYISELPSGTNLSEVVAGLNALGVDPHDMIDILKTIHAAGALHADFVVY